MSRMGTGLFWFGAGVAMGSAVALLLAPRSGEMTRRRIARRAEEGRDTLTEKGRDFVDRGREYFDKGRKIADEAAEIFDRGRRLVQE